jgi:carbon-monoxide dehydrogenase large subunit
VTARRARGAVGEPVARLEDLELSTARAEYLRDRHPEGALWLAFARASHAHAELAGIRNVDSVLAIPGVHAVLTADDLPPETDMVPPLARDGVPMRAERRPLLARGRVRFHGEPVAAILAESQYAAWDGAAAVEAELRPLPVVTDALEATRPDAALLFGPESNVLFEEGEGWEEAGAALEGCAKVVTREFVVGRYSPVPLETRGAVAEPGADGLVVWCSTQAPAQLKRAILASTGLGADDLQVVASRVGGGFGQKAHAHPEEVVAAICARDTGRPVKWLESRSENVVAASHARDQVVTCEAGSDAAGRLRVLRVDVVSDTGAYGMWPHGHLLEALGTPTAMPGPYELSAFGYRARAIATNKCPGGAYRGVGFAPATFVRERVVDILAGELQADPVQFRARSCGDTSEPRSTLTGLELRGEFGAIMEKAAAALGTLPASQDGADDVREGTGYALYVEPVSPGALVFSGRGMAGIVGYDDARVSLQNDGRIVVMTSSPPIGQGTETTFAQVVSEALGCSYDQVRVDPLSTTDGLDGTGTFASRSAASVSVACKSAALELRGRLMDAAAETLEVAPMDLEIDGAAVTVRGDPASRISFAELAGRMPDDATAVTHRTDPGWGGVAYGAHGCTVRVHTATGRVEIAHFVVAEDCGEMINPGIVRNQTLGGVAQAVGMSLLERFEYDADGRPLASGFSDYLVPRAAEAPDCVMVHHQSEATAGRRLGVGEGGAVAAAAALANAVSDALGAEVNSMPFDPMEVWRLSRA